MDEMTGLTLARWRERLAAFLVDMLLVAFTMLAFMLPAYSGPYMETEPLDYAWQDWIIWAVSYLFPLAYLTLMETYTGTTVGRRLFRLYVVDRDGGRPKPLGILVSNVGKTFLPLIDFLVGFALYRRTRQRAFSRLGGLYVAKVTYGGSAVPFNPE